jgi:hypothetical protein
MVGAGTSTGGDSTDGVGGGRVVSWFGELVRMFPVFRTGHYSSSFGG